MPAISNVILAPIAGKEKDPTRSIITVTYTVTFDGHDQALKTPYSARAYVWGDDTNVAGDAAGGADDARYNWGLGIINTEPSVQTLTAKFEVPDFALNEDRPGEPGPANSNPDEIRVKIGLKPLEGYAVMSDESNVRMISLV